MIYVRNVLDHGQVQLIDSYGSDERIVEAARMSTGKGFLGWGPLLVCEICSVGIEGRSSDCKHQGAHLWRGEPGDERLLRYLYENKHSTPFEMAGFVVEISGSYLRFSRVAQTQNPKL